LARDCLRELATIRLTPDTYQPRFTHTGDQPALTIDLATPSDPVCFFSASQGPERLPWAVTFAAQTGTTYSAAPTRALLGLAPFLARDVLDGLIERARL